MLPKAGGSHVYDQAAKAIDLTNSGMGTDASFKRQTIILVHETENSTSHLMDINEKGMEDNIIWRAYDSHFSNSPGNVHALGRWFDKMMINGAAQQKVIGSYDIANQRFRSDDVFVNQKQILVVTGRTDRSRNRSMA